MYHVLMLSYRIVVSTDIDFTIVIIMSILIGKAFPDYDIQVEYTGSSEGSQTLGKY